MISHHHRPPASPASSLQLLLSSFLILLLSHPGASNRVAVAALGPDFVFLVNDQPVGQMTADLAPGQIGLSVEALDTAKAAQVDFSDFQINAP